ncbi:MAG TPA: hypothetical protein V6C78_04165 [Crinalium sp.]|jgi:hypothetical protein
MSVDTDRQFVPIDGAKRPTAIAQPTKLLWIMDKTKFLILERAAVPHVPKLNFGFY